MRIQRKKLLRIVAGGWLWAATYRMTAAEDLVSAGELKEDAGIFVGREVGFLLLGSIALLIILFGITFIHMRKFNRSEKELLNGKVQLEEEYTSLEAEYNALMEENSKLEGQYQECRKERDKAEKLAYTDYLTALPNEASFIRILDSVMVTLRSGEVIAVLMVELSNYKEIIDQAGYRCGDELLIDAAHRLMQALDENDALAKASGNRFLILTQNIENTSGFEDKLKKIQKVFSYPFVLSTSECFVNISIGITLVPKDGKSSQTLLKNAETAVFEAARKGKNQYIYFNEELIQEQTERLQMQADMRNAAANAEYVMHYQPLLDLKKHKIIGAEALIRWEHPRRGILLPSAFLPLAEMNGQIIEIGRFVLTSVCEEWKEYVKEHPDFKIAVNASRRQLLDENFVPMVKSILAKEEFPGSCLQIDITEMIEAEERERVIDVILELKEFGVEFCFDDFGKGLSSLGQLMKVPFDMLKVDSALLESVFENNCSEKVVCELVRLAHSLGLTVTAEKVEFTEQEEMLVSAEFDCAQGYLYGHPLPIAEIRQFL
ncbi:MAG: EAL domain-containing protein [Lachnospiraceae bacterium]|nr:EAL domain-containing protein [Lachnospiraceae bacterium]